MEIAFLVFLACLYLVFRHVAGMMDDPYAIKKNTPDSAELTPDSAAADNVSTPPVREETAEVLRLGDYFVTIPFLVIGLLICGGILVNSCSDMAAMVQQGERGTGKIVKKTVALQTRSYEPSRVFIYQVEYHGFSQEFRTSTSYELGDPVALVFSRQDPKLAYLGQDISYLNAWKLFSQKLVYSLIFFVLFALALFRLLLDIRHSKHGVSMKKPSGYPT